MASSEHTVSNIKIRFTQKCSRLVHAWYLTWFQAGVQKDLRSKETKCFAKHWENGHGKTGSASPPNSSNCYHCFCSEPQGGSQHVHCSHHSLLFTGLPAATLTGWSSRMSCRPDSRWPLGPRRCQLQLIQSNPIVFVRVKQAKVCWTSLDNIPERYLQFGWPQQTNEAQTGSPCCPLLGDSQFECPSLFFRGRSHYVGCL